MSYEFEDLIAEMDDVDFIAPTHTPRSQLSYRVINRFLGSRPLASRLNPGFSSAGHQDESEFLFTILGGAGDVALLNSISGWTDLADRSACLIREIWIEDIPKLRGFLQQLNAFDHVFSEYAESVDALNELLEVPCSYLAPSLDTELFSPSPHWPTRCIDVSCIGRRSERLHQDLLAERHKRGIFYNFTVTSPIDVPNASEHRMLLADMLKRTRYSVMTRAKFQTSVQEEIGFRYFEGAAAGAVLIGQSVRNSVFDDLFGWPDAVLEVDDADLIGAMLELDQQPDRTARIRQVNIINALRNHDCANRWASILDTMALTPMAGLGRRSERLQSLALSMEAI